MGLSRADFGALTSEEFGQAFTIWRQNAEAHYRAEWEQTRFIATCSVMPHSKKIRQPRDLITFEWEQAKTESDTLTHEEHLRVMEDLEKKWR